MTCFSIPRYGTGTSDEAEMAGERLRCDEPVPGVELAVVLSNAEDEDVGRALGG